MVCVFSRYESNITKQHALMVHLFGNYALNTVSSWPQTAVNLERSPIIFLHADFLSRALTAQ